MNKNIIFLTLVLGILFITSCSSVSFDNNEDKTEELIRTHSAD